MKRYSRNNIVAVVVTTDFMHFYSHSLSSLMKFIPTVHGVFKIYNTTTCSKIVYAYSYKNPAIVV